MHLVQKQTALLSTGELNHVLELVKKKASSSTILKYSISKIRIICFS